MSIEEKRCLGAGCDRSDGTHAETCYRHPKKEEVWKARARECARYNKMLIQFCEDKELRFEKHSGHGFYISATVCGIRFMLDPSPDEYLASPNDIVRVRDLASHHYENPTLIGDVFLSEEGWERDLGILLSLAIVGG